MRHLIMGDEATFGNFGERYIYIFLFRIRAHYKKYTEEKKHQNYSLLR